MKKRQVNVDLFLENNSVPTSEITLLDILYCLCFENICKEVPLLHKYSLFPRNIYNNSRTLHTYWLYIGNTTGSELVKFFYLVLV